MEPMNRMSRKTPCYPNISSVGYSTVNKYMVSFKLLNPEFSIFTEYTVNQPPIQWIP